MEIRGSWNSSAGKRAVSQTNHQHPGEPLTMSSLEIAELTGKRHDNVMRDIRAILLELHGEERLLSFEQTFHRPNPKGGTPIPSKGYSLPKRECPDPRRLVANCAPGKHGAGGSPIFETPIPRKRWPLLSSPASAAPETIPVRIPPWWSWPNLYITGAQRPLPSPQFLGDSHEAEGIEKLTGKRHDNGGAEHPQHIDRV